MGGGHGISTEHGSAVYVYAVSIVAAMAGLLFGFDIAVINGAIVYLRDQFRLSELQTEFATSALLVGCVLGASFAGWLSDGFGRRRVLGLSALLFALSSIGAALPHNLAEFSIARFIGGVAVGVASMLAPLYIAEVSPARIRGRLVSLNQMAITTGILLSYFVNWRLSYLGAASWRYMFAAAAIPSVMFLMAMFFVPESPRWLTETGREDAALEVLTRVGGRGQALQELAQIKEVIAEESGTLRDLLEPGFRRALAIAVALAVLQQITGVNTVLFYGSVIFREQVGHNSESAALGANVVIGLINFLATIVAIWVIDKLGRRPLLMFSAGSMALCQIALGAAFLIQPPPAFLVLTAMLCCVASFAVGLGPGVWVVMAEVFPTKVRGRAMSIATISLWVACVLLTMTFLSLASAITITGAFWVYAGMCFTTFFIVWRALPETRGRTLEEIERLWKHST